jgi:hypothetical protein
MKVKLLIFGSRSMRLYDTVVKALDGMRPELVIHGGARGADKFADMWARKRDIKIVTCLPDYEQYQKRAPLVRNDTMVSLCTHAVGFWDGESTGTLYTIKECMKQQKPLRLYSICNEN